MQDTFQACEQNWCSRVNYLPENAEHATAYSVLRNVSQPLAISKRKREDEEKGTSIVDHLKGNVRGCALDRKMCEK